MQIGHRAAWLYSQNVAHTSAHSGSAAPAAPLHYAQATVSKLLYALQPLQEQQAETHAAQHAGALHVTLNQHARYVRTNMPEQTEFLWP